LGPGSESEASVWRAVERAKAVPRPAEPARQNGGPCGAGGRRAADARARVTRSPPARLPRRLRRPRHAVRSMHRAIILAVRPRPETKSRVGLLVVVEGREPLTLEGRLPERHLVPA